MEIWSQEEGPAPPLVLSSEPIFSSVMWQKENRTVPTSWGGEGSRGITCVFLRHVVSTSSFTLKALFIAAGPSPSSINLESCFFRDGGFLYHFFSLFSYFFFFFFN